MSPPSLCLRHHLWQCSCLCDLPGFQVGQVIVAPGPWLPYLLPSSRAAANLWVVLFIFHLLCNRSLS